MKDMATINTNLSVTPEYVCCNGSRNFKVKIIKIQNKIKDVNIKIKMIPNPTLRVFKSHDSFLLTLGVITVSN